MDKSENPLADCLTKTIADCQKFIQVFSNKILLSKKYCDRNIIYVDDSLCYRPRIIDLFYMLEG